MKLQPLTIELLRKTKVSILDNPEYFDMDVFHSLCGTIHCIAGWMEFHAEKMGLLPSRFGVQYPRPTTTRLHTIIGDDVLYLCDNLFYLTLWPEEYIDAYVSNNTDIEKARIAVSLIDNILEKNS